MKATNAKIVLSTDWRKFPDAKKELLGVLRRLGCSTIGQTPTHSPWARPKEIIGWLSAYNSKLVNDQREPVVDYVAIDDRMLLQEPGGVALR